MRVVQALHWLRDLVDDGEGERIRRQLQRLLDDPSDGLSTLPAWMQAFLRPLLATPSPDGSA